MFLGSLTLTLMSPCKECSRDILPQVCSNPLAFQHYIIYASYSLFVLFLLPGKEPDVAAWRVILLPNTVFPNHIQEQRMHVYMNSDKTMLWFLPRIILYFDLYNHLHQLTKMMPPLDYFQNCSILLVFSEKKLYITSNLLWTFSPPVNHVQQSTLVPCHSPQYSV